MKIYMLVNITIEKIARICVERDVTEDELNKLKNGENPFQEEMEIELDAGHGEIENNYAICDEAGRTIADFIHIFRSR